MTDRTSFRENHYLFFNIFHSPHFENSHGEKMRRQMFAVDILVTNTYNMVWLETVLFYTSKGILSTTNMLIWRCEHFGPKLAAISDFGPLTMNKHFFKLISSYFSPRKTLFFMVVIWPMYKERECIRRFSNVFYRLVALIGGLDPISLWKNSIVFHPSIVMKFVSALQEHQDNPWYLW